MPASSTLAIKVVPNAPRSAVAGWLGEARKVKIHAPPVEGRSNQGLCSFLAAHLGMPRRSVTVLRGDSSRLKIVRIEGFAEFDVRSRLASIAL